MNSTPAVFLSALLSAAIAGAVVYFIQEPVSVSQAAPRSISQEQVGVLQDQLKELQEQLHGLESQTTPQVSRSEAEPEGDALDARIAAAVAKALDERMDGAGAEGAAATPQNLAAVANSYTDGMASPDASIWQDAIDGGYMDELIQEFQARADAAPNDANAQSALAAAYIAKLTNGDVSQVEMGQLAMKADKAWGEALDIDPRHWTARFSRAMSYTHWPDFTGKPAMALDEFRTLIKQQEEEAPKPQGAQTYAILANLLKKQGKDDEASKVLAQGRQRHPDAPALQGGN